MKGCTPQELLEKFCWCESASKGLSATIHKCNVFTRPVTWCGKVYSTDGVAHLPHHIEGLVNTRRSVTGRELLQFLQGVNWMRKSLPRLATVVDALHALLETLLAGTKCT